MEEKKRTGIDSTDAAPTSSGPQGAAKATANEPASMNEGQAVIARTSAEGPSTESQPSPTPACGSERARRGTAPERDGPCADDAQAQAEGTAVKANSTGHTGTNCKREDTRVSRPDREVSIDLTESAQGGASSTSNGTQPPSESQIERSKDVEKSKDARVPPPARLVEMSAPGSTERDDAAPDPGSDSEGTHPAGTSPNDPRTSNMKSDEGSSDRSESTAAAAEDEAPRAHVDRSRRRKSKAESPRQDAVVRRPLFELPTTAHFLSYSRTPQFVEARIVRALAERRPLDHMLVHGVPGSGTTLFARAIVRDYVPRRVVELDALGGISLAQLARAIERVGDLGVLVIRHIELLDPPCEDFLARAMRGEPMPPRAERPTRAMPGESPLDRIIRQSAAGTPSPGESRRAPRFTLIGTSHILQRLGYALRTAFDHLVHLREDPKALRRAVVRSLRMRGIAVTNDAAPVFERMLGTVYDCAETLVQTCIERVDLECDLAAEHFGVREGSTRPHRGDAERVDAADADSDTPRASSDHLAEPGDRSGDAADDHADAREDRDTREPAHQPGAPGARRAPRFTIDRALAVSIIEEDLPCRLGDEHYAGALRRHLAGRVVDAANEVEIVELAGKLGWSPTTVRTAVETMVREDAAKRII